MSDFTKINNEIFNLDLSGNAFLLYTKLKYYHDKNDFKMTREDIKVISGYGETAFRKAWKELKDKGLLIQTKKRTNGKFQYEYNLKTCI